LIFSSFVVFSSQVTVLVTLAFRHKRMERNIYTEIGNGLHVFAILILLYQIGVKKNGADISAKTQELFLIVFCTRYTGLFTRFLGLYNTNVKIFYILSTSWTVYQLRRPSGQFRRTVNSYDDPFRHWVYAVVPSAVISFLHFLFTCGYNCHLQDLLWSFSICLEAVTMLPQAILVHRRKNNVNKIVLLYTILIWAYRVFYILGWIYRSYTQLHHQHFYLYYVCGVTQVLIVPVPWIAEKWGLYSSDDLFHHEDDVEEETNGPIICDLLVTEDETVDVRNEM